MKLEDLVVQINKDVEKVVAKYEAEWHIEIDYNLDLDFEVSDYVS